MTDKDFEKLFKQSEEITPRADLKNEILAKAKQEMATSAIGKEKKSPRFSPFAKKAHTDCCVLCVRISTDWWYVWSG